MNGKNGEDRRKRDEEDRDLGMRIGITNSECSGDDEMVRMEKRENNSSEGGELGRNLMEMDGCHLLRGEYLLYLWIIISGVKGKNIAREADRKECMDKK